MSTDIVEAVKTKDVVRVKALLEVNPELVQIRTKEGSLILTAVYVGAKDVLQLLLEAHPDLNIFEAAAVGDADRISAILEKSPGEANSSNADGFTPLGLSAFFGHKEVAQRLMAGGAEVDHVIQSVNKNTALDAAVAASHRDLAELLLDSGANVNPRSTGGFTPLHKAAFGGNVELSRLLLDRGADVEAETDDGRTPLDIAVERNHKEVANILRRHWGER